MTLACLTHLLAAIHRTPLVEGLLRQLAGTVYQALSGVIPRQPQRRSAQREYVVVAPIPRDAVSGQAWVAKTELLTPFKKNQQSNPFGIQIKSTFL